MIIKSYLSPEEIEYYKAITVSARNFSTGSLEALANLIKTFQFFILEAVDPINPIKSANSNKSARLIDLKKVVADLPPKSLESLNKTASNFAELMENSSETDRKSEFWAKLQMFIETMVLHRKNGVVGFFTGEIDKTTNTNKVDAKEIKNFLKEIFEAIGTNPGMMEPAYGLITKQIELQQPLSRQAKLAVVAAVFQR